MQRGESPAGRCRPGDALSAAAGWEGRAGGTGRTCRVPGHATGQGTARRGRERRESFLCGGAGTAEMEGRGKSPRGHGGGGTYCNNTPLTGQKEGSEGHSEGKSKTEKAGG